MKTRFNPKNGLTLIELMIATVILTAGLIAVLKSFFTISNALRYTQDKITAIQFLDKKMLELEEKAVNKEWLGSHSSGDYKSADREFKWQAEFTPVYIEMTVEETEEEIQDLSLNQVELSVTWQQAGRDKRASLFTYIETEEEQIIEHEQEK